ncbi:MAG: hypothetical protein HZC11_03260 [Nitrospirae bacterium]|nr:hypothetical protein [Nitrospirota bacterium]
MQADFKKKIAQFIIARLDGKEINKKFNYYQSLVRKGVGGFVVFGGKFKEISKAIKKLQDTAEIPLFIASDLERGLGQQIEGGTVFPPAMAIANAVNQKNKNDTALLRKSIRIIAQEAKAVGINVIFSPVVDVNTNPKNPIICTRAFSNNPQKVAWFGNEFIKGFQSHGLIACAKHFPGHGDTSRDSHKELPVVKAKMNRLKEVELKPFAGAIKAGVKMIMMGHLKVPAIDSKFPSSLSEKTIEGLLKSNMGFKGLVITDAMNMHAIKFKEEHACLMALKAGADIILHPSNPEKVIDYLASKWYETRQRVEESYQRILETKKQLSKRQGARGKGQVGRRLSRDLAYKLTQKSLKVIFDTKYANFRKILAFTASKKESPLVFIIDDDNNKSGKPFVNALKKKYKKIKTFYVDNKSMAAKKNPPLPHFEKGGIGGILIIAVFSKISAWKGRSGLSNRLERILKKTIQDAKYSVMIGFCCPYFLRKFNADVIIEAYSDSELAQRAAAEILFCP